VEDDPAILSRKTADLEAGTAAQERDVRDGGRVKRDGAQEGQDGKSRPDHGSDASNRH
jgi:hypothetical protein